ncbi:MAG: hypothetical protein H5T61_06895 [Thermoflexales bacterium]|nr:hypothetical protein [Thermoflexales bacterium]
MNERLYYTDRPSDVDALGFADYRPALVEVITRGETPLTIGIFGSWGTGKTSLLRMLRKDLQRRTTPHFRTVWFTAWKYERTEALWRAFILRVLDALYPREEGPEPLEERERIPFERLSKEQQKQVERLQRLEESVHRFPSTCRRWTQRIWSACWRRPERTLRSRSGWTWSRTGGNER